MNIVKYWHDRYRNEVAENERLHAENERLRAENETLRAAQMLSLTRLFGGHGRHMALISTRGKHG